MQPKPPRPTGVTVLAVLDILGGIFLLLAGIGSITLAALSTSSIASQVPGLANFSGASTLLYALGAIGLIFGILSIVVAIGFLGGKKWAWMFGIVVGVISIVVSIVETVLGFSTNVVGVIFQIIIIYYLTRPHVKAFFGKGPATAAGAMSPPAPMGSPNP